MEEPLNLVFIGPKIWGHLPGDQVRLACEDIKMRLAHLEPLLVIMKEGDNSGEVDAVIDEVFGIGGRG